MRQKSQQELSRAGLDQLSNLDRVPLIFVLENIRSGNNVGSILRTSDAFGLVEIIFVGITPTPPHREILKTSLGAEASVKWSHISSLETCVMRLKGEGYKIFALEQTIGSKSLNEIPFAELGPLAVILGNEVRGVSSEALALVEGAIEIPQFGIKHSLNVSVAAGILAYAASLRYRGQYN